MNNNQRSARQRPAGWLSALKDVKNKVITPALPKLLPAAMMDLAVPNRPSKQNAADSLPANLCENVTTTNGGKDPQEENNSCEYVRPTDVTSTTSPASESTCDDCLCREEAMCESHQLSSDLLSKLCVDDASVSNYICDQNSVAVSRSDAVQSSIFDEHDSRSTGQNGVDALSLPQSSSCNIEQNPLSTEQEVQHDAGLKSRPVGAYPSTEMRTFCVDVSDSTDIIFSSSRKKRKHERQGMYIVSYIYGCYAFVR